LLLSVQEQQAQAQATSQQQQQQQQQQQVIQSMAGSDSGGDGAVRPTITTHECDLRESLVKFVRRSYEQGLIHSTSGAMSARLSSHSFLITPSGLDRMKICAEDIVLVAYDGNTNDEVVRFFADQSRVPSRAWLVHKAIYDAFPDTQVVMHAHPFHITAFCMTSKEFHSSIIPESYIVLRTVGRIPFRHSLEPQSVVQAFHNRKDCNVLLVDNDGVMITGSSLAQVFDRLEVLEATANVVLECSALGELHPMTKEQTDEIDQKWF
jgi:L-fuculose-phosphate aldolase